MALSNGQDDSPTERDGIYSYPSQLALSRELVTENH
jgi:hypothetical protein